MKRDKELWSACLSGALTDKRFKEAGECRISVELIKTIFTKVDFIDFYSYIKGQSRRTFNAAAKM